MPFPDFGDVRDNDTALHITMRAITHGDIEGIAVLVVKGATEFGVYVAPGLFSRLAHWACMALLM